MKFLIVGLGNIGSEYWGTRHNIGFRVVNAVAEAASADFTEERYGAVARLRFKSAELVVLKPNTFMNLSGNAVRYWLQRESIPRERLLVVADDLSLPFGSLRLKARGSHGGHNGLRNIGELLATDDYARLRFGIGNDFPRGRQVDYVLSPFTDDELAQMPAIVDEELTRMPACVDRAVEIVRSFCLEGVDVAMNRYNRNAPTP